MKTRSIRATVLLMCLAFSSTVCSALEFSTAPNAKTLGEGKYELTLETELAHGRKSDDAFPDSSSMDKALIEAGLTKGIRDDIDLSVGFPFMFRSESTSAESGWGFGDISVSGKWRFYEEEGVKLAVKPGITLPTGDEELGMGAGRVSWNVRLIASKEYEGFDVNASIGYSDGHTEDRLSGLKPGTSSAIFGSVGATTPVNEQVLLTGGLGLARDTAVAKGEEKETRVSLLGGVIWEASEIVSLSLGLRVGLTQEEDAYALLAAAALRF